MLNILLPLDGSGLAEKATLHAVALARPVAAKVTLLRVVTPSEFRTEDAFSRVDWRLRRRQAQAYLEDVATRFASEGIEADVRVEDGKPAESIVRAAEEMQVNLLIMSTHGRGGATDFPQGGIAGKVLSAYDESVLLIGNDAGEIDAEVRYERLLVPIDGSPESECALRVATSLAQLLGTQLIVVCVVASPNVPSILNRDRKAITMCQDIADMMLLAAERKLAEVKARTPGDVDLHTFVFNAENWTNSLPDIALRYSPDLFIVGVDGSHNLTQSLVRVAASARRVPVLVLGPKGLGNAFYETRNHGAPNDATADVT